ncbi:MAG: DUF2339 domain-containing protein [Elusimicrobia bacterium]|nr:DUF2339 domain-containing protein [Elusimicrobiota bacterium]
MEGSPWQAWEAHLAVLVGAVYFVLARQTFVRHKDDKLLLLSEMGLASVFAVIAIPIAWKWEWITIGWSVEAAVLLAIGFRLREPLARWAGRGLLVAAGLRALIYDMDLRSAYALIVNTRSLSILATLAIMAGAMRLIRAGENELTDEELKMADVIPVFWNFLLLAWLSVEARDYLKFVYIPLHPARSLSQCTTVADSVLWTLYAAVLMAVGLLKGVKGARIGAEILFGLTALKVVLVDMSELSLGARVISFLVVGGLILFVSYFVQRRRSEAEAA